MVNWSEARSDLSAYSVAVQISAVKVRDKLTSPAQLNNWKYFSWINGFLPNIFQWSRPYRCYIIVVIDSCSCSCDVRGSGPK